MKLLLIRHGETDWNVAKRIQGSTDIPLNAAGRAQAEALADALSCSLRPVCAVYTSPLSRAAATAAVLADKLGIPCRTQEELREIGFGLWEGLTWEEVKERFPEEFSLWYGDRRYGRPPEGESYQDLLNRFVPALQKIIRETPPTDGDIIIVTHSACIMSLLSMLNATPFSEMAKRYKLSNTAMTEVDSKLIMQAV